MITDTIQHELDQAEMYVIQKLEQEPKFKALVSMGLIKPQTYIDKFETTVRPFMTEQGLLDVNAIKEVFGVKYPILNQIPMDNVRLIDIIKKLF